MDNNLKIEDVFLQIKDKLQKDNVKLWLSPYYDNEKSIPSLVDLKALAEEYSKILNLPNEECYAAISELQTNALEKLKQREHFKECGLATVKIKVSQKDRQSRLITQEIRLSALGKDLKNLVAEEIKTGPDKIKLICSGKVLIDSKELQEQGVKNGQQILALFLTETPTDIQESFNMLQELEGVKADTNLLATEDSHYMQLEDQSGNTVDIPDAEKKALMVALALHEKGRSALKREDYARALVFLLDADHEYSKCGTLLNKVDNYALLDLDIAWCYMCLQSVQHLPEAYERLARCENRFHKSYGPNMERLIAVKGTAGNEAALLVRLHLLQGIALYHQNKRKESLQLLRKAEVGLKNLKVGENSLTMLVELGYSTAEARLGLRATHGDVNLAANYINENREKRIECRKKAMTERIMQREKKKLGKCRDGVQFVEPNFVNMLVNMGYNKEIARVALQETNNIISDSIQYIQEHPLAGPSGTRSHEMLLLINDILPELEAAGFDRRMSKLALKKHSGDIMKAAEELLTNNGIIEGDLTALDDDDFSMDGANEEQKQKKKEALERLSQDISMVDDDHLDLTLYQEEEFLKQYLSLLEKD